MRGSLWTEDTNLRPARIAAGAAADLLVSAAVGLAAGLLAARVQLHLGLPGHKAVLWLVPVIAARLVLRCPLGGTAGAIGAAMAAAAAGGNLAGSAAHLPAVALAGGVLDALLHLGERWRLAPVWMVPLAGLGGLAANVVMLGKRLLAPLYETHAVLGVPGLGGRAISYALWGLAAGLLGGAIGLALARRRRPPRAA